MTLRDGERRNAAEQLELPLDQQPATPFAGKVLRTAAAAPTPPRIPAGDQRLIRLLGLGALIAALVTIGGALTIDPVDEPTRALAVAGALALTVTLGLTGLLLLRSFQGHPGVWRVRRRRCVRRGLFAGALIGGYLALRIIGLGGPTGLLIGVALVVVAEAAISRSEIDSV
ncbi:MAG: hypothetical protein JHD30_02125 [Chloroflexi bacterium]|jgi:hypothetical protein|nr:hypothetical protein [Chloroflexota bacterium]MBJ7482346.1 hypothetical protein [Chloroflexota bacterium]